MSICSVPIVFLVLLPAIVAEIVPSSLMLMSVALGGMLMGGSSLYPSPVATTSSPLVLTRKFPLRV